MSSCIHAAANGTISCYDCSIPLYTHIHTHTYTHNSFFIHSCVDGHLGSFHVLAIVNSAAMNMGVHTYLSELSY